MNDVRPGITANRYEQKFALNREDVDRLESAVAGQLRLADHGHGPETRITTVYFDHADLDLFLAAVRAPRQAVKVRLREYTTPAGMLTGRVLQMKFHEGALTQKNRVAIEPEQVPDLLRGQDGARRVIARIAATQSPGRAASTARFLDSDAFAVVCTNYRRLSYSGTDIRITFDRDIEYHPVPAPGAPTLRTNLGMPAAVEERAVMEVKMTSMARPGWLARLLDAIEPEALSKFVRAVTLVLPARARAVTARQRGG